MKPNKTQKEKKKSGKIVFENSSYVVSLLPVNSDDYSSMDDAKKNY